MPFLTSMFLQMMVYTKEELKMTNETKKILDEKIELTATCVRIPVMVSHAESVNIQFEKPFSLEKVRDALLVKQKAVRFMIKEKMEDTALQSKQKVETKLIFQE